MPMPDPLCLYLLVADYSYESNGDPVIRLFCKNMQGRTVTCFVRGFKPYFYVYPEQESDDALRALSEELKQRFSQITEVELVERFLPFGHQEQKKKMLLIVTKDPKQVRDIREDLRRYGEVFEADILFKNRFMIDQGLSGNSWFRVSNYRSTQTNTVFTELKVETLAKHVEAVQLDQHPEMRHLCIDIECLAESGNGLPRAESDPIIMISMAFSEPFENRTDLVLVSRPASAEGVQGLGSEEEMLKRFVDVLRRYDPDIVLGYNSDEFDLPYLIDRMGMVGIKPKLGRADKNSFYRRFGSKTRITIPGRVVVDVLPLVKKDFPLKSYSLGAVSREILGKEKLDVSHTEIPTLWRSRDKGLERLVEYSRRDAQLTLEILLTKRLLDRYVALAQASGTSLQDLIEGGQSIMVDNLLLRELRRYERVMPCKPDADETARRKELRDKEGLKGGHVLEPKAGLQENVLIMDYKSLYPTIMIANNICFSTLVRDKFVPREQYKGIVPRVLEGLLERRLLLKEKAKGAKEEEFRILDMTQWAVKILLNSFYGYFGYSRSRMYELTVANAVTRTGRENISKTKEIIEKEIARAALKDGKAFLGDEIKTCPTDSTIVSLEVVYGDTDSVFVRLQPVENGSKEISPSDAAALGSRLGVILTRVLPPPMELQYEAFARRALFVTKKRYALYMEGKESTVKVKGLETVRREWCNLATEAMKTILDLLLKNGDVDGAVEYMKRQIHDLRDNVTPLEKLVQTRTLSKRPQEYKGRQPHLELYNKIKKRDPAATPQIGDRVPFIITQGKGLLVERAEDPGFIRQNGLRIDHDYYIRRQILPPVRRIFEALALRIDELVADSQQRTLLDGFNGSKAEPTAEPKRARVRQKERRPVLGHDLEELLCARCGGSFTVMDLSEFRCPDCGEELEDDCCQRVLSEVVELAGRAAVHGGKRHFLCGKCGASYRRIPLTGLCECSGQVVPSSVDVEVAPLLDLVDGAPASSSGSTMEMQITMIRANFQSVRQREAPQMTLAEFL